MKSEGTLVAQQDEQVKESEGLVMFYGVEFVYLTILGIMTAFLGWLVENTFRTITIGVFDARHFILPFIPVYGLIPFAFQGILGTADDLTFFGHKLFAKSNRKTKIWSNILCFLSCCLMVAVGEQVVGDLWEKCSGVVLWNYSSASWAITKYTGYLPIFGFGTGTYLLFKFVHPRLVKRLREKMPFKVAKVIACTLGVALLVDMAAMMVYIFVTGTAPMLWSIKVW